MTLLLVMIGAGVGAPSRWALDRLVQQRRPSLFPWGTFIINVLGSLLLGLVLGAAAPASVVAIAGVGFCGGFTTFSTFSFEAVRLAETGHARRSAFYVGVSLAVGLAAATVGWWVGQQVLY